MQKKKIDKIPNFKSYKEEAEFWDTHSLADYWDEWEDVNIEVNLYQPKNKTLVVRLQEQLLDKLERLAKRKGVSLSTFARILLSERLRTANR